MNVNIRKNIAENKIMDIIFWDCDSDSRISIKWGKFKKFKGFGKGDEGLELKTFLQK